MSHSLIGQEKHLTYTMPALPSDVLRTWQFHQFFAAYRGASFSVQTRDGWRWFSAPTVTPKFVACFSTRAQLDAVIADATEHSLARAFCEGELDIQGDTLALLDVAEYVLRQSEGLSHALTHGIWSAMTMWSRKLLSGLSNSHLDDWHSEWQKDRCRLHLPVPFFSSWLGSSLANFCGCFLQPGDDLSKAQERSVARIANALDLHQDEQLLDAACGWGALLDHAEVRLQVHGCGIAFCEEQKAFAKKRLRDVSALIVDGASGSDRSRLSLLPYKFDKIIDVDILQPGAHQPLPEFLAQAYDLLLPGGLVLLHRMTRCMKPLRDTSEIPLRAMPGFVRLNSLGSELQCAESAGFRIFSVEDWSPSFRRTLQCWIDALHQCAASLDFVQARYVRSWLFQMVDIAANLDAGDLQLVQLVLARTGQSPSPALRPSTHTLN